MVIYADQCTGKVYGAVSIPQQVRFCILPINSGMGILLWQMEECIVIVRKERLH